MPSAPIDSITALAVGVRRSLVVLDVETKSQLDLGEVGAYRYARDESTDVICLCANDWQWRPGLGRHGIRDIFPPGVIIQAYGQFDRLIWKHILAPRYGWPDPDGWEWEDLMARAAYANLPSALDDLAPVLGTPGKDEEGHRLMLRMSQPQRPTRADSNPWRLHTPENINRIAAYCTQDVIAESALDAKLPHIPAFEQRVQRADRAMNERGIRVDLERVSKMQQIAGAYANTLRGELAQLTHSLVTSERDLAGLRSYLIANDVPVREGRGGLDRYAIDGFLDGEAYGEPLAEPIAEGTPVHRVLTIRRALGKSSLAKLTKLVGATDPYDFRVRGMFQYLGAKMTKRWSGKIIQPQNLPKGVLKGAQSYQTALDAIESGDVELMSMCYGDDVMDVLSSCLRCCLIATPRNELLVSDYNAIECRVAAWFAGEEWLLKAFSLDLDPYKQMASWITGKPPTDIGKQERDDGKLAELSCQYGLGWRGLKKQAKQRGRVLTDEHATHIVDTYRDKHPRIKRRWYELEESAVSAVRNPGTVYACGPVLFKFDGQVLKMRLPSGNCTWFNRAAVELVPMPWDADDLRPRIVYWGEDAQTGRFVRQTAWGGDFMALACQGIARELIANALCTLVDNRMAPVLTVHDEIGCDVPAGMVAPNRIGDLMCQLPEWAQRIPVRAASFATPFYRKD